MYLNVTIENKKGEEESKQMECDYKRSKHVGAKCPLTNDQDMSHNTPYFQPNHQTHGPKLSFGLSFKL